MAVVPNRKVHEQTVQEIKTLLRPVNKLISFIVDDKLTTIDEDMGGLIERTAQSWARILLNDENEEAPVIGRKISRLALLSADIEDALRSKQKRPNTNAGFWRTGLGQLVYRRGGFPEGPVTSLEAAAILKVTRQAVDSMRKEGKLRTARGTKDQHEILISKASLRSLWELRKKVAEMKRYRKMEEGIAEKFGDEDSGVDGDSPDFTGSPGDYDIWPEGRPLRAEAI